MSWVFTLKAAETITYAISFSSLSQCEDDRGSQGNLASTISKPWLARPSALEIKGAAVAMMGDATSRDSV